MIVLFTDFGADDIYVAQDRMIYRRSSTSITTGTLSPACALAMSAAAASRAASRSESVVADHVRWSVTRLGTWAYRVDVGSSAGEIWDGGA